MKHKYILFLLACILAVFTGCTPKHVHTPCDIWQVDATSHRMVCTDCNEILEEAAHTPDEDGICAVCTCQIQDFGDFISLYYHDAHENPLKIAEYSATGEVYTETVYQYQYDENGNVLHSKVTVDGVLTEENEYMVVDEESLLRKLTSYMEDGSKFSNEYDEHGNVIRLITYDTEGNNIHQADSEYTQLVDGAWYESKCTYSEIDGSKTVGEYDAQGNSTSITAYDAQGNLESTQTWEYVYTDGDRKVSEKHYIDGQLVEELLYKTVETEDYSVNFPETVTQYNDDGSKTVTVYDENDEIVSQTNYDSEGNVI